jgi:hypothetical protein
MKHYGHQYNSESITLQICGGIVLYFVCQNERVHSPSDCSLAQPRNHESALTTWVKALPGEETHLFAVTLGEVDDEAARRRQRHQRPRAGVPQLRVDRRRLVKSVERRRPPHRRAGEELGGRAPSGDLGGEGASGRGRWTRLPPLGDFDGLRYRRRENSCRD